MKTSMKEFLMKIQEMHEEIYDEIYEEMYKELHEKNSKG